MCDVIRIHLLPRLAEDSKRSEIGHLREQKTCTTTRTTRRLLVIINNFLAVGCIQTQEILKSPNLRIKTFAPLLLQIKYGFKLRRN